MKVLFIGDDPATLEAIQLCLSVRWPDAVVLCTSNGRGAVRLVGRETPDIVFLDLGPPGVAGLPVLHDIRGLYDVPVIIVSARCGEAAGAKGLEAGADDYVEKPFSHTVLLARISAVLRRSQLNALRRSGAESGAAGLHIDLAARRVVVDGEEAALTPTQWGLLSCLARNEGKVVPHQTLIDQVWGTATSDDTAIRMCVRRLRMKLGDNLESPEIIRSQRGMGYSFHRPA